jgi:hypothetical protein
MVVGLFGHVDSLRSSPDNTDQTGPDNADPEEELVKRIMYFLLIAGAASTAWCSGSGETDYSAKSDVEFVAGQLEPRQDLVASALWKTGKVVFLSNDVVHVPPAAVKKVSVSKDDVGFWGVNINLTDGSGDLLYRLTSGNIGRQIVVRVNAQCLFAATVADPVRGQLRIAAYQSREEAQALASILCGSSGAR